MSTEPVSLKDFYTELDPSKRYDILCATREEDPYHEFRLSLFRLRHGTDENAFKRDLFLWQCVNLGTYYGNLLFKNRKRTEILRILNEMGFESAESADEKNILYWELRNTVRRYIKTCEDPGYRRKVFGLLSASQGEKKSQMCKDLWIMTYGIAEQYDLKEELMPLIYAAEHEYLAASEDSESLDQDYRRFFKKK